MNFESSLRTIFLRLYKETVEKKVEDHRMINRTNEEIEQAFVLRATGTDRVRFARCQQARIKQQQGCKDEETG